MLTGAKGVKKNQNIISTVIMRYCMDTVLFQYSSLPPFARSSRLFDKSLLLSDSCLFFQPYTRRITAIPLGAAMFFVCKRSDTQDEKSYRASNRVHFLCKQSRYFLSGSTSYHRRGVCRQVIQKTCCRNVWPGLEPSDRPDTFTAADCFPVSDA